MSRGSNYIVMTPEYYVVRIKGKQRVAEYVHRYYSREMMHICETRDVDFDELSQQNVRDEGLLIGGTDSVCKLYDIADVFAAVDKAFNDEDDKQAMKDFLDNLPLERQAKCPGDLSDLLTEVDELYAPDVLDQHSF